MTESQTLLAQYAANGSESAFRELVTRYVSLVHSTALRLVSGDTQLAEDVTQMVFISLAKKGRALPEGVLLGGWLHRHTYHVASRAARGERRRGQGKVHAGSGRPEPAPDRPPVPGRDDEDLGGGHVRQRVFGVAPC